MWRSERTFMVNCGFWSSFFFTSLWNSFCKNQTENLVVTILSYKKYWTSNPWITEQISTNFKGFLVCHLDENELIPYIYGQVYTYRNQSFHLQCKSIDCFLYESDCLWILKPVDSWACFNWNATFIYWHKKLRDIGEMLIKFFRTRY